MKVFHVITSLNTGGAQRMLVKFIEATKGQCEHTVICLNKEGDQTKELVKNGVKVYHLRNKYLFPLFFMKIGTLFFRKRPDVIQGWMYHGNVIASVLRNFSKQSKLAWNIRHTLYDLNEEKKGTQRLIRLSRSLSKNVDIVLYNSFLSEKQHVAFGFSGNTKVLPNGFDLNNFSNSIEDCKEIRSELGIPEHHFLITQIGRNHPMKDHITFLKAAKKVLIDSDRTDEIHFLLVLRYKDKDPDLFEFINENQLQNKISVIDGRNDIEKIWSASNVGVLTSAWGEAFPNVIGEAMACETPFISTDVGDAKKIIGDCGYTVPIGDFNAIAESILKVLNLGNLELEELGKRARTRIENNYEINHVAELYLQTYQDLIASSQSK